MLGDMVFQELEAICFECDKNIHVWPEVGCRKLDEAMMALREAASINIEPPFYFYCKDYSTTEELERAVRTGNTLIKQSDVVLR